MLQILGFKILYESSFFNNILIIMSLVGLIVYFVYWFNDSRVYDMSGKLLPGPVNNLASPNLPSAYYKGRKSKLGTRYLVQMMKQYEDGNLVAANTFGSKFILTCNVDHVKEILRGSHTKFPKDEKYARMKFFLGEGLVTSQDDKWRTHRQLMNPSFHAEALRGFIRIFCDVSHRFVSKFNCEAVNIGDSLKTNMNRILCELTMDVICRSAFGFEESDMGDDFHKYFGDINNEFNDRILDFTDWSYKFFPTRAERVQTAIRWIFEKLNGTISKRISSRSLKHLNQVDKTKSSIKDLLDILLDASDESSHTKLTEAEFRDHSLTFFAAGFETTSAAISWTLYELCKHPDILAKCHMEIDSYYSNLPVSDKAENVSLPYEVVSSLEYLNQVTKEAMRLHPPVPVIGRRNREPLQLGEYLIAPETNIIMMIAALHRNPEYWVNPDLFDPDRWSPDNINTTLKSPFQYAPFSHGPRNCIGQRFAQMEMSIVLAILLRHYTVSMTESDFSNVIEEEIITQHPRNLQMTLTRRH